MNVVLRPVSGQTAITRRLQKLEEALYGTGHGALSAMSNRLGITPQRWHNAKSGRGLSVEMTMILVQKIPGLTTDWLLFGEWRGLSGEMLQRLGLIGKVDDDSATRR